MNWVSLKYKSKTVSDVMINVSGDIVCVSTNHDVSRSFFIDDLLANHRYVSPHAKAVNITETDLYNIAAEIRALKMERLLCQGMS